MRSYKIALLAITTLTASVTLGYVILTFASSSRASSESAGYIQFREEETVSVPDGKVNFDIMLINTKTISRATISFNLPKDTFEYKKEENEYLSPECKGLNTFTAVENTINETANGLLSVTKSSGANGDIPPGTHCFGTITLQPKYDQNGKNSQKIRIDSRKNKTFAQSSTGTLYDLDSIDNNSTLRITLDSATKEMYEDDDSSTIISDTPFPQMDIPCMPQNISDTDCNGVIDQYDIKSPGLRMIEDGIY